MCVQEIKGPHDPITFIIFYVQFFEKKIAKILQSVQLKNKYKKTKNDKKKVAKNVIKNIHVLCVKKYDDRNPIL